jgi:clan AA aspartic protease
MGVFSVTAEIGDPKAEHFENVEFTVDTGSSHTCLPASFLRRLGVEPHARQRFVVADGHRVDSDIGRAWLRIDGQEEMTIVVFAEENTQPLLGAITLEEFGLGVDPLAHKLIPVVKYRLTRIQIDD